tara:strand:+ start:4948 stop:5550 length:603 start_codon:yes stop_codon:yes gene_type:complete
MSELKQSQPFYQSLLSTNRNLEITNLFGLLVGGVIVKIFFSSQGVASASIWGYGLSALATFLLVIISFAFKSKINFNDKGYTLSESINSMIPPFLLLIILIWAIMLNVSNFDAVNKSNLPKEYGQYSFISSFLIIIQIISLFIYFNNKYGLLFFSQTQERRLKEKIKIVDATETIYILFLFNAIMLGMMQIVLEFFTTDG